MDGDIDVALESGMGRTDLSTVRNAVVDRHPPGIGRNRHDRSPAAPVDLNATVGSHHHLVVTGGRQSPPE